MLVLVKEKDFNEFFDILLKNKSKTIDIKTNSENDTKFWILDKDYKLIKHIAKRCRG